MNGEDMASLALTRLTRAMGEIAGKSCAQQVLAKMGKKEIETPTDLLLFANHLVERGGLMGMVGNALKITAILRGARDVP